jgi:dephospho-CoA kinase
MLRVGLTGGLGSGKSTAAALFAAHGAYILSSDEIGRALMRPNEPVYTAIVDHFGAPIMQSDGQLDRKGLARIAFEDCRVEELNAIVHPAVIARQEVMIQQIAVRDPAAVVIVESALILETKHGDSPQGGSWRKRFDKVILVRADEDRKIERFIERSSKSALTEDKIREMTAEARRRLSKQIDDDQKASLCDYVLANNGTPEELAAQVDALWAILIAAAN